MRQTAAPMPLFGSKTDISMELATSQVVAGEPVPVSLTIGEPDKKCRGARLELVYRNEYKKDETDTNDDGPNTTRTVTKREDVVAAVIPLFDGGSVQEGRHELEITVPPDAP